MSFEFEFYLDVGVPYIGVEKLKAKELRISSYKKNLLKIWKYKN